MFGLPSAAKIAKRGTLPWPSLECRIPAHWWGIPAKAVPSIHSDFSGYRLMTDPTITCPNCKAEIKLTESLAGPLLESTRLNYEAQLSAKDAELTERLKAERAAIAATEAKKARDLIADELAKAYEEKAAADALAQERETKLAEARKNELQLRQERQKLQDEKDQFELDKQRAIDAERAKIREAAQKDADDQARLKLAEKDKTITDLQVKLQDALRKAEQGSQQLQGEVQELELESMIQANFPKDTVTRVPKGEHGGDAIQDICGPLGEQCGRILWESKRTKNWSDGWLAKLRDDQRTAKADAAIIVSQVLPSGVASFNHIDGIWVTSPVCAIPVAIALRHLIVELSSARKAGEGQQTKMELIYQYLTGPRFRHRIEAIVEKFTDMQADLDKERKTMTKLWAKREEQIRCVVESTAGMYGDLQGIAGKTLQEIDGLDMKLIPPPELTPDSD